MTEPERAALDHIRQVVDSVIGMAESPAPTPLGVNLPILPVPYISQYEAGQVIADSGAAAGAMLVRAYTNQSINPADFSIQAGQSADTPLSFAQISNALSANGVQTELRSNLRLADLSLILFSGRPVIVSVKQTVLQEAGLTPEGFNGQYYLVVLGADICQAYIHDPLRQDSSGRAQAIPWLIFYQAWTQASGQERALLVPRMQLIRRVRVSATALNVHDQPSPNANVVDTVSLGDLFEISTQKSGWGKVGEDRWINLSYAIDI